ncbi:MAG: nucleoside triphosphate pyrophosphohydrolase family protein [Muribaculaceae bacterium]|nr:nucleoside triphosphate pyrophosphohydrolase family protein [Muribaculaceae bacterium]
MDFNEYQRATRSTAIYPRDMGAVYPALGLAGETGEVVDKIKKVIRDRNGEFDDESRLAIAHELGDVLWYIAAIAGDLGFDFDDIARMNVEKVLSRKARGTTHGQGDNR